jgi:hypothetical protein
MEGKKGNNSELVRSIDRCFSVLKNNVILLTKYSFVAGL